MQITNTVAHLLVICGEEHSSYLRSGPSDCQQLAQDCSDRRLPRPDHTLKIIHQVRQKLLDT